jgi:hypothetical protein
MIVFRTTERQSFIILSFEHDEMLVADGDLASVRKDRLTLSARSLMADIDA